MQIGPNGTVIAPDGSTITPPATSHEFNDVKTRSDHASHHEPTSAKSTQAHDTISSGQPKPVDQLGTFAATATLPRAASQEATQTIGGFFSKLLPATEGIAGPGLGAAGLVLGTQSPAGNADESDPNAAWRLKSLAASDRAGMADSSALEKRQNYPFVDSRSSVLGSTALADLNNCTPNGSEGFTGSSRQAFNALREVMQPPQGYETHHLVEQNQTAKFGTQAIQNTANAINLPSDVHAKISAYYSTSARSAFGTSGTIRQNVASMSFADQRQFGIDTTRRFVSEDRNLRPEVKARLLKQLSEFEGNGAGASCMEDSQ